MKQEDNPSTPKWLADLQQRSWEPEILLSGIVLYGMFKVPDLLDQFQLYFKLNIFGDSQDIDNIVSLSKMGIYWLITGLIMHLICRGIWIGMVGLSYTFPKGIRFEKLKYKGKFQSKVERTPAYQQIVIRLEKISSALFSVSFMLFMSLIGGYLFFLILLILPFTIIYIAFDVSFDSVFWDFFQVYALTLVGVGLLGLLDFVSLGYFRRFKWFAKVFWPLHIFISWLTMSRFYRPIYYGMVTNFNKWAFFAILSVFTVISIMGASSQNESVYPGDSFSRLEMWSNRSGHVSYAGYYDDQNQDMPSITASIPSDVITSDVLRLFVVARVQREDIILEHTPVDSLKKIYKDTSTAALELWSIKEYFQIRIDGDSVEVPRWFFHYKTHTQQRGYLAYVDISQLNEGQHILELLRPSGSTIAYIPFYRDVTMVRTPIQLPDKKEKESADFQPKPFGIRE